MRLSQASKTARVLLRGSEKAAVVIDANDPLLAKHLAKTGKWNRFEGTLSGDRLTLGLNGHELFKDRSVSGVPETGPICIEPSAAIEFANVYVRTLANAAQR